MGHPHSLITSALAATFFLVFPQLEASDSALPQTWRPNVTPIDVNEPIDAARIRTGGQFGGPLSMAFPLSPERAQDPRYGFRAFASIMNQWNAHEYDAAGKRFHRFLETYPDSPWCLEARLHLGCEAYYLGRYVEAEQAFTAILAQTDEDTYAGARELHGKALTRLSNVAVARGDFDGAMAWLQALRRHGPTWRERVYAAHWIQRVSFLKNHPTTVKRCGVQALKALLEMKGMDSPPIAVQPGDVRGFHLGELIALAKEAGMTLIPQHIDTSQLMAMELPVILYIPPDAGGAAGHFWLAESRHEGRIALHDPHSGRRFAQTPEQLGDLWRGVVLREPSSDPHIEGLLAEHETANSFGSCCGIAAPEGDQGNPCEALYAFLFGAPVWQVNPVNLNLYVTDVPLWYDPPYGPPVRFRFSYNGLSTTAFHEPCGAKWQLNFASYLVVDPSQTVTVFMPDGRRDTFTPDGAGGYVAQKGVKNVLEKLGDDHYLIHLQDGHQAEYDIPAGSTSQQSFLVSLKDPHDLALTFTYDAGLRLTGVTSADGKTFTLTYNADDRITAIADPFGRTCSLTYAGDTLASITDMGGYTHFFTYDTDVMMTTLGNPQGTWTFDWELPDGIDNGKDPYPPHGGTMWENMRLTITDPMGTLGEYHYDGNDARSWYVPFGNYLPYVDPTHNNLNATKRIFQFTVDDNGRDVISDKQRLDGSGIYHMPAYVHDQSMQQIWGFLISDNHSGMHFYTRNEKGSMTSWGQYFAPYEDHTFITYDTNGLDPVSFTDPEGTFSFTWTAQRDLATKTDKLGNTTSYTYDGLGRLTHILDPTGTQTVFSYGADGRLSQVTRNGDVLYTYTYTTRGLAQTLTTPRGRTYAFSFNDLNDITEIHTPEGEAIVFTYSTVWPHKVIEQNRFGAITTTTFDALGRASRITDPAGLTVIQTYDPAGNLAGIERSDGAVTTATYDAAGRLVEKTWPDGERFTVDWYATSYKPEFRITTPDQHTFKYTMVRPLIFGHYGPMAIEQMAICEDDTCFPDPAKSPSASGKQRSTPIEQAMFLRDMHGRVEEIAHSVFDEDRGLYDVKQHTFTYDANDNLDVIHDPWTNSDCDLSVNTMNQISGFTVTTADAQTYSATYTYDAHHRLATVTGNTTSLAYAYDAGFPEPKEISVPGLFDLEHHHDARGLLTQIRAVSAAQVELLRLDMDYDAQNRVTSEQTTPQNPISVSEQAINWTVNGADQITADDQGHSYTSDASGNLTSWITPEGYPTQAEYDALGRLKKVTYTNGSGTAVLHRFVYDYRGILAGHQVQENGSIIEETRTLNLNLLPVMECSMIRGAAPQDDTFVPEKFNLFGENMGHGVGGLLAQEDLTTAQPVYPILDIKGDVRGELDDQGELVSRRTYDAYGRLIGSDGTRRLEFGPNGKRVIEDLGIVYYGYRFAIPQLGRWLNRDPLGEKDGFNLYAYCHDNPMVYLDTDGRIAFIGLVGLGLTLGAGIELFCNIGPSIRDRRAAAGSDTYDQLGHQDDVWGKQKNRNDVIQNSAHEAAENFENYMPKPGDTDAIDFAHVTLKELMRTHPEFFE